MGVNRISSRLNPKKALANTVYTRLLDFGWRRSSRSGGWAGAGDRMANFVEHASWLVPCCAKEPKPVLEDVVWRWFHYSWANGINVPKGDRNESPGSVIV